jgi:hypothetical protein
MTAAPDRVPAVQGRECGELVCSFRNRSGAGGAVVAAGQADAKAATDTAMRNRETRLHEFFRGQVNRETPARLYQLQ